VGDIGKTIRRIELEPIPDDIPLAEPVPEVVPAAVPEPVPA
jgi:hypothetical protein